MSKTLKDLSVIAVTFFLLISLLSSCEKTQAQPTGDPAGIVKKNCTVCHNPQRICDSLGKKDRKEWDKTVKRMVDHGAD
ncbi:MAG TPA: hypothetical protein PLF54_07985, partial [Deltaproteobacteria bacterium]|nr:hypothetical protein [Deltaproteobacteria bacterium]